MFFVVFDCLIFVYLLKIKCIYIAEDYCFCVFSLKYELKYSYKYINSSFSQFNKALVSYTYTEIKTNKNIHVNVIDLLLLPFQI